MSERAPRRDRATRRQLVFADEFGQQVCALIENGRPVEIDLDRGEGSWLGAILQGRVTRIAQGVQGAFVDVGLGRDVFLTRAATTASETGGDEPLSAGDEILVQIIREGRSNSYSPSESGSTKGHRATTAITLPGWFLVLLPDNPHLGVSRKISSEEARERLRENLLQLDAKQHGVIARTAASEASLEQL